MDELALILAMRSELTAEDIASAESSATAAAASAAAAEAAVAQLTVATTAETEAYLGIV